MPSMPRFHRARALRHPLFWAALALLVVNDHLLKGAGVLPGWLTGKLSDVAGLVVAPVALTVLLSLEGRIGARRFALPHHRGVAFALVVAWFVGKNLVPAVAEVTTALGAAVGLAWRFWPDPTDLVALAVLPVAFHLVAPEERAVQGTMTRPERGVFERVALGLAVAASLASPTPEAMWQTDAWLVNRTGRALDVRVRWVDVSMSCDDVRPRPASILARESFAPGTSYRVEIDETLPLNRSLGVSGTPGDPRFFDAGVAEGPFVPTHTGRCDALILSVDGLPDQLVFFENLSMRTIPIVVEDDDDRRAVAGALDLVAVDEEGTVLDLVGGSGYTVTTPLDAYDGGTACRDYGTISGFDWSDLPEWSEETVRLREVRATLDDCVSIELEHPTFLTGHSIFLCVPSADFPFVSNSDVTITASADQLRIVRDLPLEDGSSWRTGELLVARGVPALREGPFDLSIVGVDDECAGVRMECGGFRLPGAGGLRDTGGTRFVHPGEAIERTTTDGRSARLRVGRAERMVATHPACGAGRDVLGPRLEALVVYGEEPR